MANVLHITASIRQSDSVSRQLGDHFVEHLKATGHNDIVNRDLSDNALPLISEARFAANLTPLEERSAEQQELAAIADELIAELKAADTLVLSLPMYNFAAPASFKAWIDLVARAGATFQYTENGPQGLLTDKKAYVLVATGGTPVGSDYDLLTPWVKVILGFMGITDVTVISADGTMSGDGPAKIAEAKQQISNIKF